MRENIKLRNFLKGYGFEFNESEKIRFVCDPDKNKECRKDLCQKECFHTKIEKYKIGDKENE